MGIELPPRKPAEGAVPAPTPRLGFVQMGQSGADSPGEQRSSITPRAAGLGRTRYADAAILSRTDGSGSVAKTEYTAPAIAAPMIGATQNIHNCSIAHPPTNTAGPVLRAGFTERFVTGIPMR